MEKSILHIKLMNGPVLRNSQREYHADSSRLDNRTESLIIINTGALSKASKDPASLIAIKRPICTELMPKNPLASDHIDAWRPGN
jgi:hypothetical protein